MSARVRYRVEYRKADCRWRFMRGREVLATFSRKPELVRVAVAFCNKAWVCDGQKSELQIRRRDNTFQDSRTYPRASDPTRSPG